MPKNLSRDLWVLNFQLAFIQAGWDNYCPEMKLVLASFLHEELLVLSELMKLMNKEMK